MTHWQSLDDDGDMTLSFIESYCLSPQLIQTIQENEKIENLIASSKKSKRVNIVKFENGKCYELQGESFQRWVIDYES